MSFKSYSLPPELLHQILLTVVTHSVHSIGTSRGTPWDIQVFTTLAKVSPLFDDIIYELVGKVFGLIDDEGEQNIIIEAEKLMNEFHRLGEPDEWPKIASAYPKHYPSYIFNAYALLSCAICLRQAATDSSVSAFLATQEGAKTTLKQAAIARSRIATPEIASALYTRINQELELLRGGTTIVRCCVKMGTLIDRLLVEKPSAETVSEEEQELVQVELSQLLLDLEGTAKRYDHEITLVENRQPRAVQLPGVARTLRGVFYMFNNNSLAVLGSHVQGLVSRWASDCPFLIKTSITLAACVSSNT